MIPSPPAGLRRLCLVAAGAIVFLLFNLGTQPFAAGLFPEPWDKLAHVLVFAVITGLLSIATAGKWPWRLLIVMAAIGSLDEWHQMYLPGRSADLADLATDLVAALCVIVFYEYLDLRRVARGARPGIHVYK